MEKLLRHLGKEKRFLKQIASNELIPNIAVVVKPKAKKRYKTKKEKKKTQLSKN